MVKTRVRSAAPFLTLVVLGGVVAAPIARADELAAAAPPTQTWVETWGASPQQPIDPVTGGTARIFSDQTVRQMVHISAGGRTFRLRLTNEYGAVPVTLDSVHLAITSAGGAIVPRTDRTVTFGGQSAITIPPNAPALSDPIELSATALTTLSISIHVPSGGNPGGATPHSLGRQTSYTVSGNQTGAIFLTNATTDTTRYFISGVDLLEDGAGGTIVTLGDSITDGFASTVDANHRWPDFLAQRLQINRQYRHLAVADEGISGNRVLSEGIGPNALSRLDRDVLSRPGLRFVTLLEGINDIGFPNIATPLPGLGTEPTADQIIAGYRQIIARVHESGAKIFGGTLTPYQGSGYYSASGDVIRNTVNAFIRTSGEFDGVLDFDAATRDPANNAQLRPAYDSGDHLHPNDTGYAAMADSINLRLFQTP